MGKAATTSSPWQDRIVRMDRVAPDQFVANERNFRVHTGEQTAALTAALEQIGWVAPVIVNETTGRLIDGHLRASLASRAGMAEVPVAYVRLTPEEEAAALLTLDNVTGMAGIDDSAFDALLREVGSLGPDLDAMLAGVAAEVGLYLDEPATEGAGGDADPMGVTESCPRVYWQPTAGPGVMGLHDSRSMDPADWRRFRAWKDAADIDPATTAWLAYAIAGAVTEVFGGHAPRTVVTVPPQGASGPLGRPYAAGILGKQVAANLDADFVTCFKPFSERKYRGQHHPAREAAQLGADLGTASFVLVVDDVVTTGGTMRAARTALPVPSLGVVWCWYHGEPVEEAA